MITKLMLWECVSFADKLLKSPAFNAENHALRIDTILLAKMHFYHLVTKSATVHNLFYGYLYELFTNHYANDAEFANDALGRMHSREKWYLTWYYDYYESKTGEFKDVLQQYCSAAAVNRTTDGTPVLAISEDALRNQAARELLEMHNSFIARMLPLAK